MPAAEERRRQLLLEKSLINTSSFPGKFLEFFSRRSQSFSEAVLSHVSELCRALKLLSLDVNGSTAQRFFSWFSRLVFLPFEERTDHAETSKRTSSEKRRLQPSPFQCATGPSGRSNGGRRAVRRPLAARGTKRKGSQDPDKILDENQEEQEGAFSD